MSREKIAAAMREYPDFPKEGILFKDICPVLADPKLLAATIELMTEPFAGKDLDLVLGIESRGFLLGPSIALKLGCGFAPIRKHGKLPGDVHAESYSLEYGEDRIEVQKGAMSDDKLLGIVKKNAVKVLSKPIP